MRAKLFIQLTFLNLGFIYFLRDAINAKLVYRLKRFFSSKFFSFIYNIRNTYACILKFQIVNSKMYYLSDNKTFHNKLTSNNCLTPTLTLSLLRYLKTRICWGGESIWPPPSKSHIWCPNMTNDTLLESSCALLLESANKFANLQKLIFFCKIRLYCKNVCKIKIVQTMINYTFLKSPWPCHFKYAKSFAKF